MCHSLRLQAGLKHPKRREGGSGLHLFWKRLITKAHRLELSGHRKINPSGGKQLWVNSSTSGLRYAYTLGEYQSAVELWIDTGSFDQNKQIFSSLSRNGRRLNAAWAYPCAGSVWSHNAPLESHGLSGRTVGRASRDGNNFRTNSFT
jgi:hypothetical protein